MTVPEVERHDLLVDLLLPEHRLIVLQAAVHEAGVVGVESVQMQRRLGENIFLIKQIFFRKRQNIFTHTDLVEQCVVLADELASNMHRGGGFHDHRTPEKLENFPHTVLYYSCAVIIRHEVENARPYFTNINNELSIGMLNLNSRSDL